MTLLIGVSGKRGSGKTSTVEEAVARLRARGIGAVQWSFARRLKQICGELFGIPREVLYGDDIAKSARMPGSTLTYRQVMQQAGHAMRQINPRVWLDAAIRDAEATDAAVAIFDDMRYTNEAEAMDHTVRLTRRNSIVDNHASETELDYHRFDLLIHNAQIGLSASSELLANYVQGVLP